MKKLIQKVLKVLKVVVASMVMVLHWLPVAHWVWLEFGSKWFT